MSILEENDPRRIDTESAFILSTQTLRVDVDEILAQFVEKGENNRQEAVLRTASFGNLIVRVNKELINMYSIVGEHRQVRHEIELANGGKKQIIVNTPSLIDLTGDTVIQVSTEWEVVIGIDANGLTFSLKPTETE